MKVAIVVYDGFDMLSLYQMCHFLSKFENIEKSICAFTEKVKDKFGVVINANFSQESLYCFDYVFFCDGNNDIFLYDFMLKSWIKTAEYSKSNFAFGNFEQVTQNLQIQSLNFKTLDEKATETIVKIMKL